MAIATEIFADLLPGGADALATLCLHNESLRLHGRCDADCLMLGCRAPYFDQAGLTTYRLPAATRPMADSHAATRTPHRKEHQDEP